MNIDKIYLTSGGPSKDVDGDNMNRMIGLSIDGGIYWIASRIDGVLDIKHTLSQINIYPNADMRHFRIIDNGPTSAFKEHTDDDIYYPITRIKTPDWQVFEAESRYMKKTVTPDVQHLGWTMDDIINKFGKAKPKKQHA